MKRLTISILAIAAATLASGTPVAAASCNGNGHQISLSRGTATPGTGSTSTTVTFSVRYADNAGCAPSRVVVAIPGVGTYALNGSGTKFTSGVTFTRAMRLPAGRHGYSFSATSGEGPGGGKTATLAAVSPSKVVINAPRPQPTPAPAQPTVQPAPAPPAPAPNAPAPTAAPTPKPTVKPKPAESDSRPNDTPSPHARQVDPKAGPSAKAAGHWLLAVATSAVVGKEAPNAAPVPQRDPAPAAGELLPDLGSFGWIGAYAAATVGGLALFFVLLRFRRSEESPAPQLVSAAIPTRQPSVAAPTPPLVPETREAPRSPSSDVAPGGWKLPSRSDLIAPIDYDLLRDPDERSGPSPHEAGIPRWLRPSVREGRFGEQPKRRRDWGD